MTIQNLVAELDEKRWPGFQGAQFKSALIDAYPQLRAAALAGAKVLDAWEIAGPCPDFHEAAKRKLQKEWPTLYNALSTYHAAVQAWE